MQRIACALIGGALMLITALVALLLSDALAPGRVPPMLAFWGACGAGVLLLGSLFGLYPFLLKIYADGGYKGAKFQAGLRTTCRQINLEIVKRSELRKFVVLPKRWIMTACTILPGRTSSGPKRSGVASYATWGLPAVRPD